MVTDQPRNVHISRKAVERSSPMQQIPEGRGSVNPAANPTRCEGASWHLWFLVRKPCDLRELHFCTQWFEQWNELLVDLLVIQLSSASRRAAQAQLYQPSAEVSVEARERVFSFVICYLLYKKDSCLRFFTCWLRRSLTSDVLPALTNCFSEFLSRSPVQTKSIWG